MGPRGPLTGLRRLRTDAPALAGVLALVVVGFGHLAVGSVLGGFDQTNYSGPNRDQVNEALRRLHFPLWDPYRFLGTPLFANPQAAVLYPFHWLLLPFPADRAANVALVVHVAIAGLGAYAFATRVLRTSPVAGFVAGGAVALSGFAHGHIGHLEQTLALAWFPWALLATDRLASADRWRSAARPAVALAVCVALTALAGHTQYVHLLIAVVCGYALLTARPLRRAAPAFAGSVLGLGLIAVQLLPTQLLSERSVRAGGLSFAGAAELSLPRRGLLTAFLPEYFRASGPAAPTVEWVAWLPWSVLALAVIALVAGSAGRRGRALGLMALAGAVVALGSGTPVFRVLYTLLPGMDRFRVPARWLLLPSLAGALLAAVGVDALVRGAPWRRRPALAASIAGAGVLVLFVLSRYKPSGLSLVIGAGIALAVLAAWRWQARWPALPYAIAAVVALELLAANQTSYARKLRIEPGFLVRQSTTAAALDDASKGRVLSIGHEDFNDSVAMRRDLRPNSHVFDELRSPDGYDGGLQLDRRWTELVRALTRNPTFDAALGIRGNTALAYDVERFLELDVTRVVSHDYSLSVPGLLPAGSRMLRTAPGNVQIWETPTLGPVFLADHTVPAGLRLRRDLRRPERLVVDLPPGVAGRTVVVSEAYAPGWTAGDGVGLRRHRGVLMAFTAPDEPGPVVLRYRQPGLALGAAVSVLSIAVAVAAALWGRRERPLVSPP